LKAVSFSDENKGTVVGSLGTIIRTTNGVTTWTEQTSGTTAQLEDVSFADANNGLVVGMHGTILKTTNGGTTWTRQTSGTTTFFKYVSFTDANKWTVVGADGTIISSQDGGETWTKQASGTSNDLYSVSFTDANNGTAVGERGTILRITNGSNTFIENNLTEIPNSFMFMQNYPNPFNPSTNINYVVRKPSKVTITIFDALGRKVTTLINEEKSTGNYTVDFNAAHLASGVYFSQMKTAEFTQTKKMLLLR
jgi:hypothetical protein